MIVRDAVFEDFQRLLPLAHDAHQSSIFAAFPMNEAVMQRNFVTAMAFEDGFVKVVEHKGKLIGGMVGIISENHFGVRCAQDLFMFSQGGSHKLIREFRSWAKTRGAQFVHITDLCGRDRYHKLVSSLGFQPSGLNFVGVA